MKLTKQQTNTLIEMLKSVDVKELEVDLDDEQKVKWFRFGSYNGLQIAVEIIKAMGERIDEETARIVD